MVGRVVSTKLKNTATVLVERISTHPLYKKTFLRSKKYLADDPLGASMGDLVEIIKVAPVSKNKHFRIVKVVGKNLAEIVEATQKKAAEEIIAEVMPESSSAEASEDKEKKVVVDNSTKKPQSKKKGRTELSKTKNGTTQN